MRAWGDTTTLMPGATEEPWHDFGPTRVQRACDDDYDGDGRAEVVVKTADGTRSGTGEVIGNAGADHRNGEGYVLSGPEYLTVFRGDTGAIAATTERYAAAAW